MSDLRAGWLVRRHPVLTAVLAALVITSAAAQSQNFTVAIVRPDGRLVPFAAFAAGRWERAWPAADEATDATVIDSVPSVWRRRGSRVPGVWRVWPGSGGPAIDATVSGLEVVDAHCSRQVALRTDLPTGSVEDRRKLGVAVDSSDVAVGAIEAVTRSDSIWGAAERAVLDSFSRLEAAEAAANRHQLPRETPVPVTQIAALFRETNSSRSPLYFIAEKTYRTPRFPEDPQCWSVTMVTGWLVPTDAGTYTLLDPRVLLTDCDAKEARRAVPLAAFRVSGQLFWVLRQLGYEGEGYAIAEIRQSQIRYPIDVNGGGC
jgi:hypothetical protein